MSHSLSSPFFRTIQALCLVIFLSFISTAAATTGVQISTTNLYCDVNTIGPYIILVKDDGTLDYFSIDDTLNAVFTKISGINKKISAAKKAISKP